MHPRHALHRWLLISLIPAVIAAPGVSGAQSPQPEGVKARSPILVEVRHDGFHWGDAGVGAAAALAVVAIAAGAVLVVRERRDRPSVQDTS